MVAPWTEYIQQMTDPADLDSRKGRAAVLEQMREKLHAQAELTPQFSRSQFRRLADTLLELYRSDENLRTEGIRLVSTLIRLRYEPTRDYGFWPTTESHGLDNLSEAAMVLPSTCAVDADPHTNLLLVGEAPGFVETKVGAPFVDLPNLLIADCISCANFNRCFELRFHDAPRTRTGPNTWAGCSYEKDDQEEIRRTRLAGMTGGVGFHTAGELLRIILYYARLHRPSWIRARAPIPPGSVPVQVTNVVRTPVFTISDRGNLSVASTRHLIARDIDWLWIEMALIRPKVTVLLGEVAREGYQLLTGNNRNPSLPVLGKHRLTGLVLRTFHPSYLLRSLDPKVVMLAWSSRSALFIPETEQIKRTSDRTWNARVDATTMLNVLQVARWYVTEWDGDWKQIRIRDLMTPQLLSVDPALIRPQNEGGEATE